MAVSISILFIVKLVISVLILSILFSIKVPSPALTTTIGLEVVNMVVNVIGVGLSFTRIRSVFAKAMTWSSLVDDVIIVVSSTSAYMADRRPIWIGPILLTVLDISLGALLVYKLAAVPDNTTTVPAPSAPSVSPVRTLTTPLIIPRRTVSPSAPPTSPVSSLIYAPLCLPENPSRDQLLSLRTRIDQILGT